MPTTPMRRWTPEEVRDRLENNPRMVERSLLVLYDLQTLDEQVTEATREHNGVGFNGVDAPLLTSFAKQVRQNPRNYPEGRRLSTKQLQIARRKLRKYAGQLARVANGRIA